MARGLKPTLNISSTGDSSFLKLSAKEKGRSISGQPDETDYRHITTYIRWHEEKHPGLVAKMRKQVEIEMRLSGLNKHAELSKDSEFRKGFWLPETLQTFFEKAYPSLFTNKKHAEWFCDKFPDFSFADAARKVNR